MAPTTGGRASGDSAGSRNRSLLPHYDCQVRSCFEQTGQVLRKFCTWLRLHLADEAPLRDEGLHGGI